MQKKTKTTRTYGNFAHLYCLHGQCWLTGIQVNYQLMVSIINKYIETMRYTPAVDVISVKTQHTIKSSVFN